VGSKCLTCRTPEIGARIGCERGTAISPISATRLFTERPRLSAWREWRSGSLVVMLLLWGAAFGVVFTAGSGGTTRARVPHATRPPQVALTVEQLTATPAAPVLGAQAEAASATTATSPPTSPVQVTSNAVPAAPANTTPRPQVVSPVQSVASPVQSPSGAPPSYPNVSSSTTSGSNATPVSSSGGTNPPVQAPPAQSPGTGTANGVDTSTTSGGGTGTTSGGGTGTTSGGG